MKIRMADGKTAPVFYKSTMSFTIGTSLHSHSFLVIDTLEQSVILGMDFMRNRVSINLENNTLYKRDRRKHALHSKPISITKCRSGIKQRSTYQEKEVTSMLKNNIIRPSQSEYASPVVLADKKNGKKRFCIDFKKLNSVTKPKKLSSASYQRSGIELKRICLLFKDRL